MTDERNITESVFRKKKNLVGVLKKQKQNMVNVCYDVSNLRFFSDITYFDLCFKKGPGCPFLTILNDRVVNHF